MFQRLLGRERRANRAIVDALYATIVAAARQPHFYSDWGVPDTPLGRFEMLSLHVFLFLHRLRSETGTAVEIAQEVVDFFFLDVDHSLRELGIGDAGVPKRMKKLARMFYGRTGSYSESLDAGDRSAFAAALGRNIMPETADWPGSLPLAVYAFAANEALAGQQTAAIASGVVEFPSAGEGAVDAA